MNKNAFFFSLFNYRKRQKKFTYEVHTCTAKISLNENEQSSKYREQ